MERRAVFPGSFDPFTVGHMDIIQRALPCFDKIIIAIGKNLEKKHLFSLEERLQFLRDIFEDEPKIEVDHYVGLTVNFCKYKKAGYILRGLRSVSDYQYEEQIARMNKTLSPDIETVLMVSSPEYVAVSSTIVREIMIHGGEYKPFVPDAVRIK